MTNAISGNQTYKSDLLDGFEAVGNVLKQTVGKGVDLLQRQYREINKQNPKFLATLKKVGVIVGTALSFLTRPLSTSIGFAAGLMFPKDVKALKDKVKDWYNSASSPMKGLAIFGTVVGLVFTPFLGGLATGAYSGEKLAEWMDAKSNR